MTSTENKQTEAAVIQTGASIQPAARQQVVTRRAAVKVLGTVALSALLGVSAPVQEAQAGSGYYKIVFKLNGGKNPKHQRRHLYKGSKMSVKRLKKPVRKGYKFRGWYKDEARTKRAKYVRGKKKVAARRVYAKWEAVTYKIKYRLNGGQKTISLPTTYTVKSDDIKPFMPVRDGYRFVGWYKDIKLKKSKNTIKTGSTGNVTLRAKWASLSYWNAHLNAKIATVKSVHASAGEGAESFIFITDIHLPGNAGCYPYLTRRVLNNTPADMVVFGGDALDYHKNRARAVELLTYLKRSFSFAEFHFVVGNHDGNCQSTAGVDPAVRIQDAQIAAIFRRSDEIRPFVPVAEPEPETEPEPEPETDPNAESDPNTDSTPGSNTDPESEPEPEPEPEPEMQKDALYYYVDREDTHVRFIMLDSKRPVSVAIDDEQLDWMKERILELDETWTVLLFSHRIFDGRRVDTQLPTLRDDKSGVKIIAALEEVAQTASASIAGVISGHAHRDFVQYSEAGFPLIVTTCDAYEKAAKWDLNYPSRPLGTTYEHSFDVVTLDTAAKKLRFTRFGIGQDREFTYA